MTPVPEPERDPAADLTDEERARVRRTLARRLQAGGIVFLLVVSLGLLPSILARAWPALGGPASVAVWFVAPAVTVALLVFAALRLRR